MSVHKIAIVTDSTTDLPAEMLQQYAVQVVPLYIVWGQEQLIDGVDLTPEAFYTRLKRDPVLPSTSQPTPKDFTHAFQKAAEQGAEEIVALTISGGLSGTILSAQQASQAVKIPVHIHDSKSTTMGLGWQVLAAARAREAGGGSAEMLAAADAVRRKTALIVSLDTLDYLHKGGRIGGATHFIGTLLELKPQVYINSETGTVGAGERARTREKAIEGLKRSFFKKVEAGRPFRVAVMHTGAEKEARDLAQQIQNDCSPIEMISGIASPVLGVHAGPAALALIGYSEG